MSEAARHGRNCPGWKDRLPGAALALAINGALLALLVFSLVPHSPPPSDAERETILFLPPPPARVPVTIDARPAPSPQTAPSAPPQEYATPGFDLPYAPPVPGSNRALLSSLGQALACVPDEKGRLSPLCVPMTVRPPDDRVFAVRPPGKNEARFAAEKACADAPTVLPGGTPLGILYNALTNPSAFADKRGYCAPPPPAPVDSVERQDQILRRISPPLMPEPGALPER